ALNETTTGGQQATAIDFSVGGGAALGYRYHFWGAPLYIQPEITGQYMRFGFNSGTIGYDGAGSLNGGLKFGFDGFVQPNVFGHLGVGFLGTQLTRDTTALEIGPQMDVGVGLDFRVVPGFLLGAQVAYNTVVVPSPAAEVDYAAKWFSFGIKAGFEFGQPRRRVVYVRQY